MEKRNVFLSFSAQSWKRHDGLFQKIAKNLVKCLDQYRKPIFKIPTLIGVLWRSIHQKCFSWELLEPRTANITQV